MIRLNVPLSGLLQHAIDIRQALIGHTPGDAEPASGART
jgi:hypothetical protein